MKSSSLKTKFKIYKIVFKNYPMKIINIYNRLKCFKKLQDKINLIVKLNLAIMTMSSP